MPEKIVEARNLTKIFNKRVRAVDNVDLRLIKAKSLGCLDRTVLERPL